MKASRELIQHVTCAHVQKGRTQCSLHPFGHNPIDNIVVKYVAGITFTVFYVTYYNQLFLTNDLNTKQQIRKNLYVVHAYVIILTLLVLHSATYRLPLESTDKPKGRSNSQLLMKWRNCPF